jgi:hypothetical protein
MQQSKNKKMKNVFKISFFSVSFLIMMFTFSCIYQINSMTQEKYLVKEYQNKINNISNKNYLSFYNKDNGVSLRKAEEMARERSFIDTENVTYIKVSSGEVVIR